MKQNKMPILYMEYNQYEEVNSLIEKYLWLLRVSLHFERQISVHWLSFVVDRRSSTNKLTLKRWKPTASEAYNKPNRTFLVLDESLLILNAW